VNVLFKGLVVFKAIGIATDTFISGEKQYFYMEDNISKNILAMLKKSKEPLETREIEKQMKEATRAKIMYRLNDLRAEGRIRGKRISAGGKGVWIWWSHC